MAQFRVTFVDESKGDEVIDADGYQDVDKSWIDFYRETEDGLLPTETVVVRLSAKTVTRIDRLEDATDPNDPQV